VIVELSNFSYSLIFSPSRPLIFSPPWELLFIHIFLSEPVSKLTLIAFSLNLILNGNLSRKSIFTVHNLITLFGIYCLLIEFDKCFIFFHVTMFSMMFWLVKDVVAYFSNIPFRYRKSRTGILPFKFALTKYILNNKPLRAIRHYCCDCFLRNIW
jgi:hypothetical protein